MDIYGVEDYDETDLETSYERLCELELSPININTATMDDLSEIPGLSQDQISDILEYRDRYGEIHTMEELSMVESLDYQQRVFLSCFFIAKPVDAEVWYSKENISRLLKYGHGQVLSNLSLPLYERAGDENGYLGYKYKYGIKVTGKFSDYIKYGFNCAQDAGEPFKFGEQSLGFDYYTFYLNINKIQRLTSLFIGRYRLRFGMGLVMNNNFSFGKQTLLSSIGRITNKITGHSSRSDANYFQGVAASIDIGRKASNHKFEITGFWSYRKCDATLNSDGTISSLLNSGYHRTSLEYGKKNNTSTMSYGGHLTWQFGSFHAGVTGVYNWFDRPLNPSYSTSGYYYRKYNPRGYNFWNASVDYGYISPTFSFSGETATGGCGAVSTLNAFQYKLTRDVSLLGVYRYYSHRYYALYSNAFSDAGKVQNEQGGYVGIQWKVKRIIIDAYTDLSYSPWLKYLISSSSYSWDNCISASYTKGDFTLKGRYRFRLRQKNNDSKTALLNRYEQRARISADYKMGRCTSRSQMDLCTYSFDSKRSLGWMISQNLAADFSTKINVSVMAAYFNTSSYDTRLYAYEKSILNTFSMPSYYGRGMRLSSVCRYDLSEHWMVMSKVGFTKYFDRDVIGTDLRQINASYETDIDLQLRYKF